MHYRTLLCAIAVPRRLVLLGSLVDDLLERVEAAGPNRSELAHSRRIVVAARRDGVRSRQARDAGAVALGGRGEDPLALGVAGVLRRPLRQRQLAAAALSLETLCCPARTFRLVTESRGGGEVRRVMETIEISERRKKSPPEKESKRTGNRNHASRHDAFCSRRYA